MSTWDPTRNVAARIAFTSGNTIATQGAGTSTDCSCFGTTSQSTGKYSFTVVMGQCTAGHTGVGMGTASGSTAAGDYLGKTTQTFGGNAIGAITLNNVGIGTAGPNIVTGDTIDSVVDFGGKLFYMRRNSGLWNNSASGDPVGNVGGLSIATLASFVLFPAADLWAPSDAATVSFSTNLSLSGISTWDTLIAVSADSVCGFESSLTARPDAVHGSESSLTARSANERRRTIWWS